jgi:glycerol-3-phosphate dehydrogenase (NAD(P)+)
MIGVLGGGAWGTALAQAVASGGEAVRLWAREPEVVSAINADHANPLFLPDVALSPLIAATTTLSGMAGLSPLLLVVPAQHLAGVLAALPLQDRPTLVLCAKGIEATTGRLMSEVVADVAPHCPLAVLSGPSFAADVARGLPTAVTLAAATLAEAEALCARLARPAFRLYASNDIIGAEVGGAVKNVLAIACGVAVGAGLGDSARAALLARGFAEMTRFAVALGARAETLSGLSGLGDLVLTCGSPQSRNMALGMALGRGQTAAEALAGRASVAEGAATAPILVRKARVLGIEMPVAEAVDDLVAGRIQAVEAITRLLARPLRPESHSAV